MCGLRIILIALSFYSTAPSRAFAAEAADPAAQLRSGALTILADLEALGYKGFGREGSPAATSFGRLREEIGGLAFKTIPQFKKPAGAMRFSAFYVPAERTVYVNGSEALPEYSRRALGLHEALGALGYDDQDYQVSLGADFLAKQGELPDPERLSRSNREVLWLSLNMVWRGFNRETPIREGDPDAILAREGGGGNVVGGAGDGNGLLLKAAFLNALLADAEFSAAGPFYFNGLAARIEIGGDGTEIRYEPVHQGLSSAELRAKMREQGVHLKHFDRAWAIERQKQSVKVVVPPALAGPALEAASPGETPAVQDMLFFFKSTLLKKRSIDVRYRCESANGKIIFDSYRPAAHVHPAADQFTFGHYAEALERFRACKRPSLIGGADE